MHGYTTNWKFRQNGQAEFSVPVSGQLYISHSMTMTACTVSGLEPCMLLDWLCREEINIGTLIDLFPAYECVPTNFETSAWLVYPSRVYLPAKLRIVIDFLKSRNNRIHLTRTQG